MQESQPVSLSVTIHDVGRQKEKISLLKGMLWHKTDKMFSRWKERFFILTPNHLQCYKQCPISTDDLILFTFKVKQWSNILELLIGFRLNYPLSLGPDREEGIPDHHLICTQDGQDTPQEHWGHPGMVPCDQGKIWQQVICKKVIYFV